MPRKIEQRNDGGGFECLVPDQLPELFADGVSQLQLGTPFSRIMFHSVTEPGSGGNLEQRVAKLSLVIPTTTLLELVANITDAATPEAVAGSEAAATNYVSQVSQQFGRLLELNSGKLRK